MMAWLQLWTFVALLSSLVVLRPGVEAGIRGSDDAIVKKETHPVLFRQKREWIWNSLYVEEEKPAPVPYKIGALKSSLRVEVKNFQIKGEGANTIFTVDQKGDLFVTRSLDREEKSAYHLTAQMFDGNNRLVEDSGDFVVQVTDINDNIPVFPNVINESIPERSSVGTNIVTVKARDADDATTANGELRYSLIRGGDRKFQIDEITGMISCNGDLDRETISQYVLVIRAQDMRGKPSGSTATTSVTINILDINDNIASFTRNAYEIQVREDQKLNENMGILELEDRDLLPNKVPRILITGDYAQMFSVEPNTNKDGILMLKKPLDYETMNSHTFTVVAHEDLAVRFPENKNVITTATVTIKVTDVDEPPVFSQPSYTFTVVEERLAQNIGTVSARDPDKDNKIIRYSILDPDCPFTINPRTGQLSTVRALDRELEATHMFQVKAQEDGSGLESFVKVDIIVQDINDNKPELMAEDIFVCENDRDNMVLGTLRATDNDEHTASFSFSLASLSSNFSIKDHGNNTADILVKQGPFNLDDSNDYSISVRVGDGGRPLQTSVTHLAIKACRCDHRRVPTQCKAAALRMGVSVHALIAILLCILTILVIVILFVMRKRYQKDHLASMKHSGEIHEQLVTYDEEGGGEMDTNGYDVSILSSACHDGSLLRHPDHHPHPSLYAMVQKPHHQPTACKGDMAAMIEVKKDEADHDRDGFPYDTLHIYGYEGPESLAGSLSSLESSSDGSNLDYDFLNDWGPRFRTLAEMYGVDGREYYHQY